jgi:hypothetical protein
VGLAGALASWIFHRWTHRPGGRLGVWLDRLLVSDGIEGARKAIDEIDRFARERP